MYCVTEFGKVLRTCGTNGHCFPIVWRTSIGVLAYVDARREQYKQNGATYRGRIVECHIRN